MAKNNQQTPYQLYQKEYKRLQQAIRRQRKKGYDISAQGIDIKTPGQLKKESPSAERYFAEIEVLKGFTPETLRNIASNQFIDKYLDYEDEDQYGYENEPYPPDDSTYNQAIIDRFNTLFTAPSPPGGNPSFARHKIQIQDELRALWEDTLDATDEYTLAYLLEQNAEELHSIVSKLQYDSGSIQEEQANLLRVAQILYGGSITALQADAISESAAFYGYTDRFRGGI